MGAIACELDHLVVTAPTLAVGVAWVDAILGVAPQASGEHQRMGTHNALLRLGDARYLEVLAINPAAPPPGRPRWFALDGTASDSSPRLAGWIARTDDIRTAKAECSDQLGEIEQMTRGALNWLITIPADGSIPGDGVVPTLIEWHTHEHPASQLENQGCSLVGLEAFHPNPNSVTRILDCLGVQRVVVVNAIPVGERPYLVAHVNTRNGPRTIGGPLT